MLDIYIIKACISVGLNCHLFIIAYLGIRAFLKIYKNCYVQINFWIIIVILCSLITDTGLSHLIRCISICCYLCEIIVDLLIYFILDTLTLDYDLIILEIFWIWRRNHDLNEYQLILNF